MSAGILIIILREWIINKINFNCLHKAIHLHHQDLLHGDITGILHDMDVSRMCTRKQLILIKSRPSDKA